MQRPGHPPLQSHSDQNSLAPVCIRFIILVVLMLTFTACNIPGVGSNPYIHPSGFNPFEAIDCNNAPSLPSPYKASVESSGQTLYCQYVLNGTLSLTISYGADAKAIENNFNTNWLPLLRREGLSTTVIDKPNQLFMLTTSPSSDPQEYTNPDVQYDFVDYYCNHFVVSVEGTRLNISQPDAKALVIETYGFAQRIVDSNFDCP
jgi:hypothetical protein